MADLIDMILPPEDPIEDIWEAAGQTFSLFLTKAYEEIAGCEVVMDERCDTESPCLLEAQDFTKTLISGCLEHYDYDEQSTVWGVSPEPDSLDDMTGSDMCSLSDLRSHAAKTLYSASLDGRLKACLLESQEDNIWLKAQDVLLQSLESGRLETVISEVNVDKLRDRARQVLVESVGDGRLLDALKQTQDEKSLRAAEATRMVLTGALADGRLEQELKQSTSAAPGDDVRESARNAILQGASSGGLEAALADLSSQSQQLAIVPRPPADRKPQRSWERPRFPKMPVDNRFQAAMHSLGEADRQAGSLYVEIQAKTRQIQEREATCKKLTSQIKVAAADLEHLRVDHQWHEEQIALAEARGGQLRENRIALALTLEDIRQGKQLTDASPTEFGKKLTNSSSERSLASTCAGSGVVSSAADTTSEWQPNKCPAITEA